VYDWWNFILFRVCIIVGWVKVLVRKIILGCCVLILVISYF